MRADRFTVAMLAVLAAGCQPTVVWYGHSPDRTRVVRVLELRDGTQAVMVDSKPNARYEAVGFQQLAFSPDGEHLAFPVRDAGLWRLVVDGQPGRRWNGIGEVLWSADGKHVAYLAQASALWVVVRDEVVSRPWRGIVSDSLRLSPDGGRLAYAALDARGVHAVVDRVRFGPYEDLDALQFSPDGARFAFAARLRGAAHVVTDGKPGPVAERVHSLRFSLDGARVAYVAVTPEGERVVLDGVPGPRFGAVVTGSLRFAPDGTQLAYVILEGERRAVVVGQARGEWFEQVTDPTFAASGAHWGYVGRRAGQSYLVIDGKARTVEPGASSLVFTGSGADHAYVAMRAGRGVVVHPRGVSSFDLIVEDTLVVSEDGTHWACLVGVRSDRRLYVSVDGAVLRRFDLEELVAQLQLEQGPSGGKLEREQVEALRSWVRAELRLAFGRAR